MGRGRGNVPAAHPLPRGRAVSVVELAVELHDRRHHAVHGQPGPGQPGSQGVLRLGLAVLLLLPVGLFLGL